MYEEFEKFRLWAKRQCSRKNLAIQTDNTLEFKRFSIRLVELGIIQRFSIPYNHQQMGMVERRHCHLIDTAITLICHAGLPDEFWDFTVFTTCFLYNRNLTQLL